MGADEHQGQPLVRKFGRGRLGDLLGDELQVGAGRLGRPAAPSGVDQLAAGDREQPGLRVGRHPA
jgi:hypothetical protein